MTRQRPSLRTPRADENLQGFPAVRLAPSTPLWRVGRNGQNPWWFSSRLEGRFDLPAPHGTCYLANDDLAAILELVGPGILPGGAVPASLLADRHLRLLSVPAPRRLANVLSGRATRWITAEISTLTPYGIPQAWAAVLHARGFAGIRYAVRHSTSTRHWSVGLFGRAGEARWKRGRRIAFSEGHRRRLLAAHGVLVFDPPAADELVFAPE